MANDELPGGCALIPLAIKGDERGSLIAIEQCREVPFEMARVYYLFGTGPDVTRGLHAHRQLQQLAIAVAGSCTMLLDDGTTRTVIRLDDPSVGLLIRPMIWREMSDFTPDCVLLVVADAPYDEADYIRDYDEFLAFAAEAQA
jgi:dTDP-4-dehydrorhamnose 3,5-epimerase